MLVEHSFKGHSSSGATRRSYHKHPLCGRRRFPPLIICRGGHLLVPGVRAFFQVLCHPGFFSFRCGKELKIPPRSALYPQMFLNLSRIPLWFLNPSVVGKIIILPIHGDVQFLPNVLNIMRVPQWSHHSKVQCSNTSWKIRIP